MYCSLAKYNTTTKSVDWLPYITQGKQAIEITDKARNCLTDLNVEQIKTIPNLTKLIDSYETGEPKILDFAQGIRDGSIQLKDGQTMLQGYQSYLQSTGKSLTLADIKTKALSASMKVFSTLGWTAIA